MSIGSHFHFRATPGPDLELGPWLGTPQFKKQITWQISKETKKIYMLAADENFISFFSKFN